MRENNFQPLVSVIMNCHNGAKFIESSIDSVLKQNYKNWELIFFDNASTDKSLSIVKSFNDSRIKIFRSKDFLNLYDARNQALKKIEGRYVSFLDTDDLWEKDLIRKQVKYLSNNLNLKMVYSNFYILNSKKNKKILRFKNYLPQGKITNNLIKSYTIAILTSCVKADIFKKIKFNKDYNVIGDFDFFIKLSEEHEIGYIHEPLASYRIHDKNYSKENLKTYIMELSSWTKDNATIYKSKNISLFFLKFYLLKLKVKYIFSKILRITK